MIKRLLVMEQFIDSFASTNQSNWSKKISESFIWHEAQFLYIRSGTPVTLNFHISRSSQNPCPKSSSFWSGNQVLSVFTISFLKSAIGRDLYLQLPLTENARATGMRLGVSPILSPESLRLGQRLDALEPGSVRLWARDWCFTGPRTCFEQKKSACYLTVFVVRISHSWCEGLGGVLSRIQ